MWSKLEHLAMHPYLWTTGAFQLLTSSYLSPIPSLLGTTVVFLSSGGGFYGAGTEVEAEGLHQFSQQPPFLGFYFSIGADQMCLAWPFVSQLLVAPVFLFKAACHSFQIGCCLLSMLEKASSPNWAKVCCEWQALWSTGWQGLYMEANIDFIRKCDTDWLSYRKKHANIYSQKRKQQNILLITC